MLMFCVCTAYRKPADWEQAAYPIRRLVSGALVADTHLMLMENKVGYKRRDVYGTLLAPTPHLN